MEKDNARTEAARLLGRMSANTATPEQRAARARKGGKAAQKKLTKAERSRRAKLRWQRWREKRGQELPEAEMDIPESILRYEANKKVEP